MASAPLEPGGGVEGTGRGMAGAMGYIAAGSKGGSASSRFTLIARPIRLRSCPKEGAKHV